MARLLKSFPWLLLFAAAFYLRDKLPASLFQP
jgi:hypothetical protein